MLHGGELRKSWSGKAAAPSKVSCILLLILMLATAASAQKKQLVQVKTFDEKLVPYKNVEVSINNKDHFQIGAKGVAIVELLDTDFPIQSIKIKDTKLETASWNYGKGIIEVIIRTKSYQLVPLLVRNENDVPMPNIKVTFKGGKTTSVSTDTKGHVDIPLGLEETIVSHDQFSISGFRPVRLETSSGQTTLIVEALEHGRDGLPVASKKATSNEYFKDFDLSKLDSIQSLTVFYAIFKNYQIGDMSEEVRMKIDAKFNQLMVRLQDSVSRNDIRFLGRISDSSYVADDIRNLLSRAELESQTLDRQRAEFDDKIKIIQDKLAAGISNMDEKTRANLLSDLTRLEMLLIENEGRFYKNQNDYRAIINSLKEKYFDITDLENRLSESEAQRLEEQRAFRQKLFITLSVLFVFAVLILLLIYVSDKLKKQRKELIRVNNEINRINENLEGLVAERTKLLEEANKELDTFLYRASHDLRSPVCSIIGLCNIALHMSDGESRELVQRVVLTTTSMDKLLKKLSMISEINQPSNFSSITLVDLVDNVKKEFSKTLSENKIRFDIDCPADLVIYSYPNLIETILENLLENAFFFSMIKDTDAVVSLKAEIRNDSVEIILTDNGIGVDESVIHRLFDMFFKGTELSKGNGLGLYIVQKSVQALDGKIEVESELGRFTKFTVNLPLKSMAFGSNLAIGAGQPLDETMMNQ